MEVLASDQLFDDMNAVEMVVDLEEGVEQKQLTDGVGKVHELDGHVAGDQVVAVQLAADDTAHLGNEVLNADHATRPILALSQQVAIHLIHYVTNRLHTRMQQIEIE